VASLSPPPHTKTRGMLHHGLAIYNNKKILRQKKNYGNSNISPCKKYLIFKKILFKNPKSLKILL